MRYLCGPPATSSQKTESHDAPDLKSWRDKKCVVHPCHARENYWEKQMSLHGEEVLLAILFAKSFVLLIMVASWCCLLAPVTISLVMYECSKSEDSDLQQAIAVWPKQSDQAWSCRIPQETNPAVSLGSSVANSSSVSLRSEAGEDKRLSSRWQEAEEMLCQVSDPERKSQDSNDLQSRDATSIELQPGENLLQFRVGRHFPMSLTTSWSPVVH